MGMAASVRKTVRVAMARAVSPGRGARTCPVTLLALQEGQALDPNVLVPMRVIGHWAARVWQGSIPMDRVEAHWESRGAEPSRIGVATCGRSRGLWGLSYTMRAR